MKSKTVWKLCVEPECGSGARGSSGLCKRHGGGKRCVMYECDKSAQGSTDFCVTHGGGKRCVMSECDKSAQGSTDFCVTHGGGKRCVEHECTNSARGSTDLCKRHGGGKRCVEHECDKSAQGSTDFCVKHGGGKRCVEHECTNSAIGSTDLCKRHGGGKRCVMYECDKSAHGKTGFCKTHWVRCVVTMCSDSADGNIDGAACAWHTKHGHDAVKKCGFNQSAEGWIYVIQFTDRGEDCIVYGKTNGIETRMAHYRCKLTEIQSVERLLVGIGQDATDFENKMNNLLRIHNVETFCDSNPSINGLTESFYPNRCDSDFLVPFWAIIDECREAASQIVLAA